MLRPVKFVPRPVRRQNAVSNRGGPSQTGSGPRGSIPAESVFGCVRRQRFVACRPDWPNRLAEPGKVQTCLDSL